MNIVWIIIEKVPAEKKNSTQLKRKIEFSSNTCQYWACGFGAKSGQTFFFANRNFIAAYIQNFNTTNKLAPAGTLRFAQSPIRGLAISLKRIVCAGEQEKLYIYIYILAVIPVLRTGFEKYDLKQKPKLVQLTKQATK